LGRIGGIVVGLFRSDKLEVRFPRELWWTIAERDPRPIDEVRKADEIRGDELEADVCQVDVDHPTRTDRDIAKIAVA